MRMTARCKSPRSLTGPGWLVPLTSSRRATYMLSEIFGGLANHGRDQVWIALSTDLRAGSRRVRERVLSENVRSDGRDGPAWLRSYLGHRASLCPLRRRPAASTDVHVGDRPYYQANSPGHRHQRLAAAQS